MRVLEVHVSDDLHVPSPSRIPRFYYVILLCQNRDNRDRRVTFF